jgi:hypothetical protein
METNWWQRLWRSLLTSLMAAVLIFSLIGCGASTSSPPGSKSAPEKAPRNISEVSPPLVIQQLRRELDNYQPQVAIVSPQPDEVLQDNTVTVRFQVENLPIFKNADLGLGPHLHVFLDNQPYQAVYNLNQPLVLENLPPGTHTLRAFASRPWHESFKNEGAYTQTTFHIFTKTDENNPSPDVPLLTYSRPQASYGAEPIMLDFYLTNAPLHLLDQESPDSVDWQIRCTINGESFTLDQWQPLYLKGFKPGKNWVQLELVDEQGNPVKNVFNNTVRVITYEPQGKDTLSQLVRGELSAADARGIVDPNYTAKVPTPEPTPAPTVIPEPTPIPAPVPSEIPSVEETPTAAQPQEEPPQVEPKELEETKPTAIEPAEESKSGGYFNRFRRPETDELTPLPPKVIESPASKPATPETAPEPEAGVTSVEGEATPSAEPMPTEVKALQPIETPAANEETPTSTLPTTLPEIIVTPSPEPEAVVPQPETLPETESSVAPQPSPEPITSGEEKAAVELVKETSSAVKIEEKTDAIAPAPKPLIPNLDWQNLKKIFFPKPAASNSKPPVIQVSPQPEVPSPSLEPSAPATPEP